MAATPKNTLKSKLKRFLIKTLKIILWPFKTLFNTIGWCFTHLDWLITFGCIGGAIYYDVATEKEELSILYLILGFIFFKMIIDEMRDKNIKAELKLIRKSIELDMELLDLKNKINLLEFGQRFKEEVSLDIARTIQKVVEGVKNGR